MSECRYFLILCLDIPYHEVYMRHVIGYTTTKRLAVEIMNTLNNTYDEHECLYIMATPDDTHMYCELEPEGAPSAMWVKKSPECEGWDLLSNYMFNDNGIINTGSPSHVSIPSDALFYTDIQWNIMPAPKSLDEADQYLNDPNCIERSVEDYCSVMAEHNMYVKGKEYASIIKLSDKLIRSYEDVINELNENASEWAGIDQ